MLDDISLETMKPTHSMISLAAGSQDEGHLEVTGSSGPTRESSDWTSKVNHIPLCLALGGQGTSVFGHTGEAR